jgi:hypothetical protein
MQRYGRWRFHSEAPHAKHSIALRSTVSTNFNTKPNMSVSSCVEHCRLMQRLCGHRNPLAAAKLSSSIHSSIHARESYCSALGCCSATLKCICTQIGHAACADLYILPLKVVCGLRPGVPLPLASVPQFRNTAHDAERRLAPDQEAT